MLNVFQIHANISKLSFLGKNQINTLMNTLCLLMYIQNKEFTFEKFNSGVKILYRHTWRNAKNIQTIKKCISNYYI